MGPVETYFLFGWTSFAVLGAYVAGHKRRPAIEGVALGLIFGPVGCLVLAMLPTGDRRR